MVEIYPFKALHFSEKLKEEISLLVSPPYDIISDLQKKILKKSHKENIVKLILPEDSDTLNRYENAAALMREMITAQILETDKNEAFYIFEELFFDNGTWKSFKAFIGLNRIEEYESSKVLRHEYTLSKPKEDRFSLLRQTNTNFGLIYTLYDDTENKIQKILDECTSKKPFYDFTAGYDSSLKFKVWKLTDKHQIRNISELMKDKNILIADGHHRYETSRLFMHKIKNKRQARKLETSPTVIEALNTKIYPEEAVLTLFVNYNQENIKILPTYRMIKFKNDFNLQNNFENIKKYFTVKNYSQIFKEKPVPDNKSDILKNISKFMKDEKSEKKHSFCLLDATGEIFFLTLNKKLKEIYPDITQDNFEFENLDVRILHRLLIEDALKKAIVEKIDYTHSESELYSGIINNKTATENIKDYDLGIILNAPSINDVQIISAKGQVMPQKSTYFYPKPCSGLIMYKMDL